MHDEGVVAREIRNVDGSRELQLKQCWSRKVAREDETRSSAFRFSERAHAFMYTVTMLRFRH